MSARAARAIVAIASVVWLVTSSAGAQVPTVDEPTAEPPTAEPPTAVEPERVRLAIDPAVPVSAEEVARGLATRLSIAVELASPDDPAARARVLSTGGRGARIEVPQPRGRPTRRRVSLPRREDERVAALVLHLESLLRDDAAELVARLRRDTGTETAAEAETETGAETEAESETETEAETGAESEVESERRSEEPTQSAVLAGSRSDPRRPENPEAGAESETETATASDPYRTLLRIGLGTQLGAYRDADYELVWWAGLHVAVTFTEWIALGIRELGSIRASRWASTPRCAGPPPTRSTRACRSCPSARCS